MVWQAKTKLSHNKDWVWEPQLHWEHVQTSTSPSQAFQSPTHSHRRQDTQNATYAPFISTFIHPFLHSLLRCQWLRWMGLYFFWLLAWEGEALLCLSVFPHRPVETWWMRLHVQVLHVCCESTQRQWLGALLSENPSQWSRYTRTHRDAHKERRSDEDFMPTW